MKTFPTICLGLMLTIASAARSMADAPKAKAADAPPRSIFTQPSTPREGRDPFFPESTRVFDAAIMAHVTAAEAITTLAVKGFSVVDGRPIVIINNHSFMAGDEGDVLSNGNHAHVRCLQITAGAVIVEVNGARQIIHF